MSKVLTIAKDEWRFWLRSRLALWGIGVFVAVLLITSALTLIQAEQAEHARLHDQTEAEARFASQPDRHPHRMVHYGHYVFRAPAPLAAIDPGLDAVTGQSMFLEGHRQNSAAFADVAASANLGGLSLLTPALVYQLFGSLLVVLLGYGAIVREREAGTLPTLLLQGVRGEQMVFGKWLALLSLAAISLLPLFVVGWVAEGFAASAALAGAYLMYLLVWAAAVLVLSSTLRSRGMVLTIATSAWLCVCLLVPSLAVDAVSRNAASPGKIESELAMVTDLRELGDGHNAADPAFASMRANLLAQYDVERVEDLPVNFRGVVASYSEEKLTAKLNEYAQAQLDAELAQSRQLGRFGWLSPMLAVASASRAISGTDITHYHRFLREAEGVRYRFVQGLNKVHSEVLSFEDDMNRNNGEEASQRARVSADNWRVLEDFRFVPAALSERLTTAMPALLILAVWIGALFSGLLLVGRRLAP
ncbi:MAG: DUF3526 domain-containing protein [Pseudomonadota bacterium]